MISSVKVKMNFEWNALLLGFMECIFGRDLLGGGCWEGSQIRIWLGHPSIFRASCWKNHLGESLGLVRSLGDAAGWALGRAAGGGAGGITLVGRWNPAMDLNYDWIGLDYDVMVLVVLVGSPWLDGGTLVFGYWTWIIYYYYYYYHYHYHLLYIINHWSCWWWWCWWDHPGWAVEPWWLVIGLGLC